jgi:hypothetical protein
MICKVTPQEAIELNLLSAQAENVLAAATGGALLVMSTSGKPPCMQLNAVVHALSNQLLLILLAHRQAHGQWKDVSSTADLKKRPEVILALVGDLNELMSAVLRGVDPGSDYMLNLFKLEKSKASGGGEA